MRAIHYDHYGPPDGMHLEEVAMPVPGDGQVLVRIHAASVNPSDWHFLTGLPYLSRLQFGLRRPKLGGIGSDLAGVVEAVGSAATQFRCGDEVFGHVDGEVKGRPLPDLGSLAEYVCVSEDRVVPKPANITFEQAGAVAVAGFTALQGLRDTGGIAAGQQVLINGSSGGVGTFAVQIAKAFGAEVTGVCSTRNVDLVRSLGADHVVDYTKEDFAAGDRRYDLMLDNVGNRSLRACRRALKRKGTYVASFGQPEHRVTGPMFKLLRMFVMAPFVGQKMTTWVARPNHADLVALGELIEAGKVIPVVDRTYPLDEASAAMRYLEQGHAQGKVVVTV